MNLNLLQALYVLKKIDSKLAPTYAVDLLMQGYDSYHLRLLGGVNINDAHKDEVNTYLSKIFKELKLPNMEERQACMVLAKEYAKKITTGELSPYEGARKIWWELWNEYGYPEELADFVNYATDYEDTYPKDPKILERIIIEAKKIILDNR